MGGENGPPASFHILTDGVPNRGEGVGGGYNEKINRLIDKTIPQSEVQALCLSAQRKESVLRFKKISN